MFTLSLALSTHNSTAPCIAQKTRIRRDIPVTAAVLISAVKETHSIIQGVSKELYNFESL
jgi:hypothetical protein